jgi:predicted AAA+ superfamily ATPase
MKNAPKKVYVVDNGFIASKVFSLSDNLGRLLENQVFVELLRRGYDIDKTLFYYRSQNDKEVDFVLRRGTCIESLVQVCYDMSNAKTEKREVDSIVECAEELKCDNLIIVTSDDSRLIEKKNYKIKVVPFSEF